MGEIYPFNQLNQLIIGLGGSILVVLPAPATAHVLAARIWAGRPARANQPAHRKRQQAQHPRLTLTDMYNVLAKLRAGEPLSDADRHIHEQGLVSILRQLHDDLDAAVLAAYGWEDLLDLTGFGKPVRSGSDATSDALILERLVALNAERAAEEASGRVRWLRPEYQARDAVAPVSQPALLEEEATAVQPPAPTTTPPWPDGLAARAAAVRAALVAFGRPMSADEVAASFAGRATDTRRDQTAELLQTLAALGQARLVAAGRWSAE
jgi:hypothetical protein